MRHSPQCFDRHRTIAPAAAARCGRPPFRYGGPAEVHSGRSQTSHPLPWMARRLGRLCARHLRLGRRVLRPTRLSARHTRRARMAAGIRIRSRHRAFSGRRGRSHQSPGPASAFRRGLGDQGERAGARYRRVRLGLGDGALAAVCRHAAERLWLERHERRSHQRDRLALVHPLTTRGVGHGLQWWKHRRRHLLAAVGGSHPGNGISHRRCNSGCRHGPDHMDSGRHPVLEITPADGFGARRRCTRRDACASARATGSAAPGTVVVAQCQLPHAGCRHGYRFVRARSA